MTARQDLADAASAVAGLNVVPYFRQSSKVGDGWVRLDHIDYPDRFGGVATWEVFVVCPNDMATAEKWIEDTTPLLVAALRPQMTVQTVTPNEIALNDTRLTCVVVQGIRETE